MRAPGGGGSSIAPRRRRIVTPGKERRETQSGASAMPSPAATADIIAGLQHLKPTHSFRANYAYDNLLYVVAGEVAAAAGDAPSPTTPRRPTAVPASTPRCAPT